ncbi:MAG: hypothetical protein JO041_14455 [Acidobacteria bacterium]|nr:hypothetical protein [Acidobacteriota bacterium]
MRRAPSSAGVIVGRAYGAQSPYRALLRGTSPRLEFRNSLLQRWADYSGQLHPALRAPGPPNPPSLDGSIGGVADFLAFHEAYHMGQLMYVRLGYPALGG